MICTATPGYIYMATETLTSLQVWSIHSNQHHHARARGTQAHTHTHTQAATWCCWALSFDHMAPYSTTYNDTRTLDLFHIYIEFMIAASFKNNAVIVYQDLIAILWKITHNQYKSSCSSNDKHSQSNNDAIVSHCVQSILIRIDLSRNRYVVLSIFLSAHRTCAYFACHVCCCGLVACMWYASSGRDAYSIASRNLFPPVCVYARIVCSCTCTCTCMCVYDARLLVMSQR